MKCNRCTSPEDLRWPENWKKGQRPINSETGKEHICKENIILELGQMSQKQDIEKCNICHKPFTNEWKGHLHRV